jgi:hypothetical protein
MLTTFFDLETQIRSHQDELQRQAAAYARIRSVEAPGRRSTSPSQPITTFVTAIQRALAGWLSPNRAPVACATCA